MPLDNMSPGILLEKEVHNRKNYPYVYYCPGCNRSYMSREPQEGCKFCAGPARLVTGRRINVYFCQQCNRRTESEEAKMACQACGSKFTTLYRWDMLSKGERKRIKFARFLKSLAESMPKIGVKERMKKRKKLHPARLEKKEEGRLRGEELPS